MPYAVACCTLHQLHVVVACCMRHAVVVARRALNAAWGLSHSGLGLLHCRAVHRIALPNTAPVGDRWRADSARCSLGTSHRRSAPPARPRSNGPTMEMSAAATTSAADASERCGGRRRMHASKERTAALRCCCGGDEHCVSTDRSGRPALPINAVLCGTRGY